MPQTQRHINTLSHLWDNLTSAFSLRDAALAQGKVFDNCFCLHHPSKQQIQAELDHPNQDSLLHSFSRYKLGCSETTRMFAKQLARPIAATLRKEDLLPEECVILIPPARDHLLRSPVIYLANLIGKALNIPCCSAVLEDGRFAEITYSGIEDPKIRAGLRDKHFKNLPSADGSAFHWILIDDAHNTGSTLKALDTWVRKECRVWSVSQFALCKFDLDCPGKEAQISELALKHGGIEQFLQIVSDPANHLTGTAIRTIYSSAELLERCLEKLPLSKIILLNHAGALHSFGNSAEHQERAKQVFEAMAHRISQAAARAG